VRIKTEWGYDVPVDKSSRRYDFVVETKRDDRHSLVLIEANFYGGGGSKLKATAGEYRNLYDTLGGKYRFVWITDGMGWKTTTRSLEEPFNHNDEILNLNMLEKGALEHIL
jgi:type II restriction enzyme